MSHKLATLDSTAYKMAANSNKDWYLMEFLLTILNGLKIDCLDTTEFTETSVFLITSHFVL